MTSQEKAHDLNIKGIEYKKQGLFELALECYSEAMKYEPENRNCYLNSYKIEVGLNNPNAFINILILKHIDLLDSIFEPQNNTTFFDWKPFYKWDKPITENSSVNQDIVSKLVEKNPIYEVLAMDLNTCCNLGVLILSIDENLRNFHNVPLDLIKNYQLKLLGKEPMGKSIRDSTFENLANIIGFIQLISNLKLDTTTNKENVYKLYNKTNDMEQKTDNINERNQIKQLIFNATNDKVTLIDLFNKYKSYPHPEICYLLGVMFLNNNINDYSIKALIKGASFGLSHPSNFYNSLYSDCVGQCYFLLSTNFSIPNNEVSLKLVSLGYLFLSKCIELYPKEAFDSYRSRALLLSNELNSELIFRFVQSQSTSFFVKLEPFIISDCFFSSNSLNSPHQNLMEYAKSYHYSLEDESISGKDANDYTTEELAQLGTERHKDLFQNIEKKYCSNQLYLTLNELYSIFPMARPRL